MARSSGLFWSDHCVGKIGLIDACEGHESVVYQEINRYRASQFSLEALDEKKSVCIRLALT